MILKIWDSSTSKYTYKLGMWYKHRKWCCIYTIFNPPCNMTQKGRRTRRTYFERHHQLHCHELAKLVEMSTKQQKINEHINYKMIRKMIFKKVYMIGWRWWWMAQWVTIGKISAKNDCCEDVLMQKNCTNNSVPFQKDIPFLRQLLSDIIIINEIPFQIELFSYF